MQFHIQTGKDKVLVLAEVVKIEVEDILSPEQGDELFSAESALSPVMARQLKCCVMRTINRSYAFTGSKSSNR
jgi:hypothetical protein